MNLTKASNTSSPNDAEILENPRGRLEHFLGSCSSETLLVEMRSEWLNELIPGLRKLFGCDQGRLKHLEGDVAVHTALVFSTMSVVANRRLNRHPTFIEQISVLMHDLRKPDTREPLPNGGVSFPGHEELAAKDVPAAASRLGLSPDEQDQLFFLVARHGLAHALPELAPAEKKKLRSSEWIVPLALLQEADALSCLLPANAHLPVFWDELTGQ